MNYIQSLQNVKLVIFELDSGILRLNDFRYNYIKNHCNDEYFSNQEFNQMVGDLNVFRDKINVTMMEEDLRIYTIIKKDILQSGIVEAIDFLIQKNIQIAIVSSHTTTYTVEYLKRVKLYHKVNYIIGCSGNYDSISDPQFLIDICKKLKVGLHQTLVVAPYLKLVECANEAEINVVSIGSFTYPNTYTHLNSNLDLINTIIFGKYDDIQIYDDILKISKNQDEQSLQHLFSSLYDDYKDDVAMLNIIERLCVQHNVAIKQDDFDKIKEFNIDTSNHTSKIQKANEDEVIENNEIIEKRSVETIQNHDFTENMLHINNLLNQVNENANKVETVEESKVKSDKSKAPTNTSDIHTNETKVIIKMKFFTTFLNHFVNQIIYIFIALIGYLVFEDFLNENLIINRVVHYLVTIYTTTLDIIIGTIFNGLHTVNKFIPSYEMLLSGNNYLSALAMQCLLYAVTITLMICIIKFIYISVQNRGESNEFNF